MRERTESRRRYIRLTRTQRMAALEDPAYHRYLTFGPVDAARTRALGRDLYEHETLAELRGPQIDIIRRIERATADRRGEIITVRSARQTGKNETAAQLQDRALAIWRAVPGSTWVRTAPTYKPQLVVSRHRLERHLACDPLLAGDFEWREGYICESGHAQVIFLSAGAQANVLGSTASVCLDCDEGHKIDSGKFDEELAPFTASTNAPIVLWGVAADKTDLLHDHHRRNLEDHPDRALEFPAAIWAEISPAYAAHYQERRAKLGPDHPVMKTQYDLEDIEAAGAYLNPSQRAALFSGDHTRLEGPRPRMGYFLVVDVGGEAEEYTDDPMERLEAGDHDSTWATILEVDPADMDQEPFPPARVVQAHAWTGRHLVDPDSEEPDVGKELVRIAEHWQITHGAIDARGVGEAVAGYVERRYPAIEAYKATSESASEDCYDLLARLNTRRITWWRADPATDPERREIEEQARHTAYIIRNHDRMNLTKPTGAGSTGRRIDGLKALTYARRAVLFSKHGLLAKARRDLAKREQETNAPD